MRDRDDKDHHGGLARDLRKWTEAVSRREAIGLIGGASLLPLFACAGASKGAAGECSTIPQETAGPFPGDGTNGANALALSGIVRSDIRSSIGGAAGVAVGVPLALRFTLADSTGDCSSLAGYAVYVWHCDRDGAYSMYSGSAASENYLRGVQEADGDGQLTFASIFPGCYSGRWPHIHFEIYASLAAGTTGANSVHVSQLALPEASCAEAYATNGYEQSIANLRGMSLSSDNVFSDGASRQIAAVTGNATDGYLATLTIGIPA